MFYTISLKYKHLNILFQRRVLHHFLLIVFFRITYYTVYHITRNKNFFLYI
jgi:hypothetical protein